MLRPLRLLPAVVLAALVPLVATPARATSITIDALTEAFPPNPCLPVSGQELIFTGSWCDGVSCPPGTVVTDCGGSGFAAQVGLPGVLGGVERAALVFPYGFNVSARIIAAAQRVDISVPLNGGGDGYVVFYSPEEGDWGLDLYGMGVTAIHVPLSGAITPAHPLVVRIVMSDYGDDVLLGGYAEKNVTATAAGDVVIPLAAFTVSSDFDYRSVDAISLQISECGNSSCPEPEVPARQFSIGPFTMDTGNPTASRSASWGGLKIRYR
jgi:hypothetical protein